jgi:hypothetical protein
MHDGFQLLQTRNHKILKDKSSIGGILAEWQFVQELGEDLLCPGSESDGALKPFVVKRGDDGLSKDSWGHSGGDSR